MAKSIVTALKVSPSTIFAKVVPGDNAYVTGGIPVSLAPGAIADPSLLGLVGPSSVPAVPPGIHAEALGGYYSQFTPGTTLANGKLQYFQPSGAELAAGAYPGAITGGFVVLEIPYSL